jgi:hypothetical protein
MLSVNKKNLKFYIYSVNYTTVLNNYSNNCMIVIELKININNMSLLRIF